jgi:putative ABC transport system permease protein
VQLRTMEEVVGASLTRQRFLSLLLGIFAGVALLLAAIGTYGVLSYMVSERHREIGIRMALGAGRANVVRLVLRDAGWMMGLGVVVGVSATLAVGRAASSLLYGMKANDPTTLALAVAVLVAVGLVSSYLPARQAARLDPLTALRQE